MIELGKQQIESSEKNRISSELEDIDNNEMDCRQWLYLTSRKDCSK